MYSKTPVSGSGDITKKPSMLGDDMPGVNQEASGDHSGDTSAGYDKTSLSHKTSWFPLNKESPLISYTVEMNIMWCVLLALAFITRFWRIDFPSYVV